MAAMVDTYWRNGHRRGAWLGPLGRWRDIADGRFARMPVRRVSLLKRRW